MLTVEYKSQLNPQKTPHICELWDVCVSTVTKFTNPRMHLFPIPQCFIQNRNVNISVLNGILWDMEQVHSGICEIGLLQKIDRYNVIVCLPSNH